MSRQRDRLLSVSTANCESRPEAAAGERLLSRRPLLPKATDVKGSSPLFGMLEAAERRAALLRLSRLSRRHEYIDLS